MQAKDIDDAEMLRVILEEGRDRPANWVFTWDLERRFPAVPPKVVLAKARALLRRKLIDGCPCGCRGDFHLTDAGCEMLTLKV